MQATMRDGTWNGDNACRWRPRAMEPGMGTAQVARRLLVMEPGLGATQVAGRYARWNRRTGSNDTQRHRQPTQRSTCGFQFGRRPAGSKNHRKTTSNSARECGFHSGRRPAGNNTQPHREQMLRPNVASNFAAGQLAATNSATECGFHCGRRPASSNTQGHKQQIRQTMWLPIWPPASWQQQPQKNKQPIWQPSVVSILVAGRQATTHSDTDSHFGDQMLLPTWSPTIW